MPPTFGGAAIVFNCVVRSLPTVAILLSWRKRLPFLFNYYSRLFHIFVEGAFTVCFRFLVNCPAVVHPVAKLWFASRATTKAVARIFSFALRYLLRIPRCGRRSTSGELLVNVDLPIFFLYKPINPIKCKEM